ncbi:MAG: nucleoside hydrolase [Candidatus Dormibacteraeota bacterium]|nr:nucleoside hydrolase [Candidatus Dormibacteraeota bacterium]
MSAPRRVILDCDPGHDDALAILLAQGAAEIDLAAVTTVAGNHPLTLTTLNALRVCELAGIRDVPVAAGCASPLLRELVTAPEIHGEAGLEGHDWPPPSLQPVPEHAVDVIIDLVMSSPGEITLVPIGPLTNIALALRREPRLAGCVQEVVVMGGSFTRGNVTPAAEFNVFVDPEAAAVVFGGGWPVTMVGLDVTEQVLAREEELERIAALDTPVSRAVMGLLRFYGESQLRETGTSHPPVHDPCAVAGVARPQLLQLRPARVDVELAGRLTAGMTVTDFRPPPDHAVNAGVATTIDQAGFWELFVDALGRLQ